MPPTGVMHPPASARLRRQKHPTPPALEAVGRDGEAVAPHATWGGTIAILLSLFLTGTNLPMGLPSEIARFAAMGVGAGLLISVVFDFTLGWRNLIRADLMALAALYFLVFAEFLFDQNRFNQMILSSTVAEGIVSSLWGVAGLVLGRHLLGGKEPIQYELFQRPISSGGMMVLLLICFFVGFLNIMLSVNFDVLQAIDSMMGPRFSQPWTRGRFGNWSVLLGELLLLIYVIPAIAGVAYAKYREFSKFKLVIITLCFGFTLFYGFSSGTRNVFASFIVTFMIAYGFSLPREHFKRLMVVAGMVFIALMVSTSVMLEFRNMGMNRWLAGQYEEKPAQEEEFFVDHNLLVISSLTQIFPDLHGYLGLEIPYVALIRPIPRAIWPGKPEGLSISIEEAMGVEGLTLASSFIGEAYMSGGNTAVFLIGLLFGAITGWWSRLANPANSDFGTLVYASGFFATVITMRSLFVFTTAILPTVGAIVLGYFMLKQARHRLGQPEEAASAPARKGKA